MGKFLIVATESQVRDAQVAIVVDAEHTDDNAWMDFQGQLVVAELDSDSTQSAINAAAEMRGIAPETLVAYEIKQDSDDAYEESLRADAIIDALDARLMKIPGFDFEEVVYKLTNADAVTVLTDHLEEAEIAMISDERLLLLLEKIKEGFGNIDWHEWGEENLSTFIREEQHTEGPAVGEVVHVKGEAVIEGGTVQVDTNGRVLHDEGSSILCVLEQVHGTANVSAYVDKKYIQYKNGEE